MTDIINTFVFPIVRRDYILDALTSLRMMTPPNYQVIVVDQTRPDAEFEERLRRLCDVHVKTYKNYGFAQGTNIGWRLALAGGNTHIFELASNDPPGGELKSEPYTEYARQVYDKCDVWMKSHFSLQPTKYLTTCNDDVVFIWGGWWQGIIESFRRYDTAVCVNPMSPREPGWGYGKPGFIEHLTLRQSVQPKNILRLIDEKKGQMIDGLTCWCSVFKASLFDEIGMFDERFMYGGGEDYDICARIYLAGYRALATSLAWVYHYWGQSKDEPDGLAQAQPAAREYWNKLGELWPEGFDIWGKDPETQKTLRRVSEVAVMPL